MKQKSGRLREADDLGELIEMGRAFFDHLRLAWRLRRGMRILFS
jgi:hypothetical protein